jgi:DNA repair protein RadC
MEFIGLFLNIFHGFSGLLSTFLKAFFIPMPYIRMEYCYEKALLKAPGDDEVESCPSPLSRLKEDRPRERLIRLGPESLSDEELLSIILVSGIHGKNVSLLARELLSKLEAEKKLPTVSELCRLSGLGISKACTVSAMLEFGRRKWASGQRIKHPEDIFDLIRHHADRRQEKFISISLNGAHEVLAIRIVTIGLVNRTIIHPREVLADPLQDRASSIAVAHNHPSGNLQPSMEDRKITQRLKDAAEILGINFLDHLIFSDTDLFSFRREGLIIEKEKKLMD